jgi:hypothetical protein
MKIIDVYNVDGSKYNRGDEVTVVASMSTGRNAVILGFGIPFLILIFVIFGVSLLTKSEPLAALVSIGSLIPYYIILYILRNKIRQHITFKIE